MKLMVISHSLVHERQQWFFKKVAELTDLEVIAVGPRFWRTMSIQDYVSPKYSIYGLPANNEGDIVLYTLSGLDGLIERFKPDLIYCQAEAWSMQAHAAARIAALREIPFAIFLWENIKRFEDINLEALKYANRIVCGNTEAINLLPDELKNKAIWFPQVGVETSIFKPNPKIEKKYDVVYSGRMVSEKGVEIIKAGCNALGLRINFISGIPYSKLPDLLNEGMIFASLPVTTPLWKEQSGSYAIMEAMACGLPVITTRCGAIPEYLNNMVIYCQESNLKDFIMKLLKLRDCSNEYKQHLSIISREYIQDRFSNDTLAKKLPQILWDTIKS